MSEDNNDDKLTQYGHSNLPPDIRQSILSEDALSVHVRRQEAAIPLKSLFGCQTLHVGTRQDMLQVLVHARDVRLD